MLEPGQASKSCHLTFDLLVLTGELSAAASPDSFQKVVFYCRGSFPPIGPFYPKLTFTGTCSLAFCSPNVNSSSLNSQLYTEHYNYNDSVILNLQSSSSDKSQFHSA